MSRPATTRKALIEETRKKAKNSNYASINSYDPESAPVVPSLTLSSTSPTSLTLAPYYAFGGTGTVSPRGGLSLPAPNNNNNNIPSQPAAAALSSSLVTTSTPNTNLPHLSGVDRVPLLGAQVDDEEKEEKHRTSVVEAAKKPSTTTERVLCIDALRGIIMSMFCICICSRGTIFRFSHLVDCVRVCVCVCVWVGVYSMILVNTKPDPSYQFLMHSPWYDFGYMTSLSLSLSLSLCLSIGPIGVFFCSSVTLFYVRALYVCVFL